MSRSNYRPKRDQKNDTAMARAGTIQFTHVNDEANVAMPESFDRVIVNFAGFGADTKPYVVLYKFTDDSLEAFNRPGLSAATLTLSTNLGAGVRVIDGASALANLGEIILECPGGRRRLMLAVIGAAATYTVDAYLELQHSAPPAS